MQGNICGVMEVGVVAVMVVVLVMVVVRGGGGERGCGGITCESDVDNRRSCGGGDATRAMRSKNMERYKARQQTSSLPRMRLPTSVN